MIVMLRSLVSKRTTTEKTRNQKTVLLASTVPAAVVVVLAIVAMASNFFGRIVVVDATGSRSTALLSHQRSVATAAGAFASRLGFGVNNEGILSSSMRRRRRRRQQQRTFYHGTTSQEKQKKNTIAFLHNSKPRYPSSSFYRGIVTHNNNNNNGYVNHNNNRKIQNSFVRSLSWDDNNDYIAKDDKDYSYYNISLLSPSSPPPSTSSNATNTTFNDNTTAYTPSYFVKTTPFCTHVVVPKEFSPPLSAVEAMDRTWSSLSEQSGKPKVSMASESLLEIGAVWYLPANVPKDPSLGQKMIRLNNNNNNNNKRDKDGTAAATTNSAENNNNNNDASSSSDVLLLQEGDYLRIHHHPRRFPVVNDYRWDRFIDTTMKNDTLHGHNNKKVSNNTDNKSGVLVYEDAEKGYVIIDKPSGVPVHGTVDNIRENVLACLLEAGPSRFASYLASPQRLDQNTSGLIVLATTKLFANYYSGVLRNKTEFSLRDNNNSVAGDNNNDNNNNTRGAAIHKEYRCLVCILSPNDDDDSNNGWSVASALEQLQNYAKNDGVIIRHYLEPSIKAPKRFVESIPSAAEKDEEEDSRSSSMSPSWAECLMKIKRVRHVCAMIGHPAGHELSDQLWSSSSSNDTNTNTTTMPENCKAVAELTIELLTGRTHQIRGQLSALGFPIVGDVPYGGGRIIDNNEDCINDNDNDYNAGGPLALQCYKLEFLDPDLIVVPEKKRKREKKLSSKQKRMMFMNHHNNDPHPDDTEQLEQELSRIVMEREERMIPKMIKSTRWNKFYLEEAWWTQYIQRYQDTIIKEEEKNDATLEDDILFATTKKDTGIIPPKTTTANDEKTQLQDPDGGLVVATAATPPPKQQQAAARPDLLPPDNVVLSPGRHKYVLLRATSDDGDVRYFVKSAAPNECGGPYHKDVARDLVEWIEHCGYSVRILGGGRIDYCTAADDNNGNARAHVYGFSYGYGKGNHALVARIIREWSRSKIHATYDMSDRLY